VLPVDRWQPYSSSTCPIDRATLGRADALAFLRETLADKPDGDVGGIVGVREEALVERLPST